MKRMNTYAAAGRLFDTIATIMQNDDGNNSMISIHEQLEAKPKIDDVICHYLDGEALKDALFIIDNIREHDMKIKVSSINVWSVQYKGKHVCDLRIKDDSLHIGQVSGVLAIRVTNMSYDHESLNRLIEALRDSITGAQDAVYALQ